MTLLPTVHELMNEDSGQISGVARYLPNRERITLMEFDKSNRNRDYNQYSSTRGYALLKSISILYLGQI